MMKKTPIACTIAAAALITTTFLTPAYAQTAAPAPGGQMASATDPSAKADPDMAKVLAALQALGPKPIQSWEPSEARKQP